MCYLCGPDKAARAINAALKVWRGKDQTGVLAYRQGALGFRRSWGYRHDWTKPPKKAEKLRENADYGVQYSEWTDSGEVGA